MAAARAYRRLNVDERRRRLLDAGAKLFAAHAYDEISMRAIAREAGISKALLYHYFPSKTAFFRAALQEAAAELERAIAPDPALAPIQQLTASLDAYLAWIDANGETWRKVMRSAEAAEVVEGFRAATLDRVASGLTGARSAPPALRVALQGWLGYLDRAILDWIDRRDLSREQLRTLLVSAFGGALAAAHAVDPDVAVAVG
jgi:AcrR family transcriptional regulator